MKNEKRDFEKMAVSRNLFEIIEKPYDRWFEAGIRILKKVRQTLSKQQANYLEQALENKKFLSAASAKYFGLWSWSDTKYILSLLRKQFAQKILRSNDIIIC